MLQKIQLLVAGVILALLAGCSTPRHCQHAGQAVAKYHFQTNKVQEILGAEAENIDMLILSGGGSHGAWGAGVLRGWRDNPQNPRPKKFRIVTGVSTGALIATFAFLGEPMDDELLERAYTTLKTSDIYRKKFLLTALFSDSLNSSSPLRHTIKKFISQETVDRVARAGREENRRLFVGTVNHDTGKLVIWDLTAIAMDATNKNRLELYRKVVFASASIPILVPPVEIDGNLYADGGARAQLFFERRFLPAFRDMRKRHEERPARTPNLTFHVIVNGKLGLETNCVSDCLLGLTTRTLEMLLDANEFGDLYHLKYVLKLIGFGQFRLSYIPPDFEITSSEVFEPEKMGKLFRKGVEFGKTTAKWGDQIPDPDFEDALHGLVLTPRSRGEH